MSLVRTAPLERFEEIQRPDREPETDEHPSYESVDPDNLPPRTVRAEALAPATRREPVVDSRRLAKTLLPGLPDVLQSSMKIDIDYLDPLDRTQQRPALDPRELPALGEDDEIDDATVVAERPAFLKKRGMLPKDRANESLVPKHPPSRSSSSSSSSSEQAPHHVAPHVPPARTPSGGRRSGR